MMAFAEQQRPTRSSPLLPAVLRLAVVLFPEALTPPAETNARVDVDLVGWLKRL
jgi:hypothetical protein